MIITDLSQLDPNGSYTYADYLTWQFPEYVEVIRGRVFPKATPWTAHQQCVGALAGTIGQFLKRKPARVYMGPFDVRLTKLNRNGNEQIRTVVQPDICVVCKLNKLDDKGCLGAPDWIIEVVSPSSLLLDTRTKFDLYAENGVTEYWIAFPKEQFVNTFILTPEGEYELAGTYAEPGAMPVHTLPGLVIEWADIFEELK